jgi:hypothetical protein
MLLIELWLSDAWFMHTMEQKTVRTESDISPLTSCRKSLLGSIFCLFSTGFLSEQSSHVYAALRLAMSQYIGLIADTDELVLIMRFSLLIDLSLSLLSQIHTANIPSQESSY